MRVISGLRYVGTSLLRALLTIWVVCTFTFFLVKLMPGDPLETAYESLLMQGKTPQQARALTASIYGFMPQGNALQQYWNYLTQLAHGNFGTSITAEGISVSSELASAVSWTVGLVLAGVLVSAALGVVLGVIAAMRRDSRLGSGLTILGSVLHGIPQYVMALILVTFLTVKYPVFSTGPVDGALEPGFNGPYIASLIAHAVLPALAFALSSFGGYLLTMKSSVVSVLGDDFILAAEVRGLSRRKIFAYVARNAVLPLFTVLTLSLGFMFGGAVFIENAFNYPGMGQLLISSVGQRDYPVMNGAFLLITVAVIIANLLADLLYTAIDPRVRRGAENL
ncbi:ABC transporter permease [Bifidobacterium sp.]|jgi:peptide/nickel transport system permease protein|uniref:ABC transporter permease n=1 Tax=Bifidobacterium sp. TaxID=41200 RepID=UPI0025C70E36|nr:ABC transporter permease [Bifidobacterium sp.]MCH4209335.1 ABC transporter permease [Bifidobacterium sp.]MCI1224129.1 ABC transporter permease [Bifidobacterium sp.]